MSHNFKKREVRNIFPVTKVVLKNKPQERTGPDIVRLRILDRPYRWYNGLTYHWKAFIKTALISAFLIIVPYNFAYMVSLTYSKAEVLSKSDPLFTTDGVKSYAVRRQQEIESGRDYERKDAEFYKKIN